MYYIVTVEDINLRTETNRAVESEEYILSTRIQFLLQFQA